MPTLFNDMRAFLHKYLHKKLALKHDPAKPAPGTAKAPAKKAPKKMVAGHSAHPEAEIIQPYDVTTHDFMHPILGPKHAANGVPPDYQLYYKKHNLGMKVSDLLEGYAKLPGAGGKVPTTHPAKKPAAKKQMEEEAKEKKEEELKELHMQWLDERGFNKSRGYKWTPSFARWLKRQGLTLAQ